MSDIQRPPAEIRWADELALLQERDRNRPVAPGWQLSAQSVVDFVLGDGKEITAKYVGRRSLVERCVVSLATNRGLMLIGEPGTAKSLLSELLAAAISGDTTLTIQGSAATTEDAIKYSWNYALLLAEGPTLTSLVPAPIHRGMTEGKVVRFEEITRCAPEVQDSLLSVLSDRSLSIPELDAEHRTLHARQVGTNGVGNHRCVLVEEQQSCTADHGSEGARQEEQPLRQGMPEQHRRACQEQWNGHEEGKDCAHACLLSPVSGCRVSMSSCPMTAIASMRMVTARVMTMAVRTKACGSGSANAVMSVPSVMGSARHPGTPVLSRMKFAAWLSRLSPNTARTMERCSNRYTPPVTSTKMVAMRITGGTPPLARSPSVLAALLPVLRPHVPVDLPHQRWCLWSCPTG